MATASAPATVSAAEHNALKKEAALVTEVSRQSERELKLLRRELERVRSKLSVHERATRRANAATQTYAGVADTAEKRRRDEGEEEAALLRSQSALDMKCLQEAEAALSTALYKQDAAEKRHDRLLAAHVALQRECHTAKAGLERETARSTQLATRVAALSAEVATTSTANESLENQSWRTFWERRAVKDVKHTCAAQAAACAALLPVAIAAAAAFAARRRMRAVQGAVTLTAPDESAAAAALADAALPRRHLPPLDARGTPVHVPAPSPAAPAASRFLTVRELRQREKALACAAPAVGTPLKHATQPRHEAGQGCVLEDACRHGAAVRVAGETRAAASSLGGAGAVC